MDLLSALQILGRSKLRHNARQYIQSVHEQNRVLQQPALAASGHVDSPTIILGVDRSGRSVTIPIHTVRAHGLIIGASGAGKSCGAIGIMKPIASASGGFGVIDGKPELFSWLASEVVEGQYEPKPLLLNFGGTDPVPYALLKPRIGESPERLIERRMEAFDDLLGRDGHLSLRMSRMLRNLLRLMVEHDLPFPIIEFLFAHADVVAHLAGQSPDTRLRDYFKMEFERERQTTQLALSARLDSLLRHRNLRLSFGSDTFVDFREAMDQGAIVLVNAGGQALPRSHTRLIQSLIVSDIRQAVFERQERQRPFTWFIDEAQCLFTQPSDIENVSSLLSMARSFGVNLVLITQSLVAASPTADFLTSIETNFKWLLLFRCGVKDAAIIEPALPVSGRIVGERHGKGEIAYLTRSQEIAERVRHIAGLPTRQAYLWLRGAGSTAIPLTIQSVRFPQDVHEPPRQCGDTAASEINRALQEREQQLRMLVERPRSTKRGVKRRVDDVIAALERDLAEANQ